MGTVCTHLVLTEDVGHVFVQPVKVVPDRERKLFDLCLGNIHGRRSLLCNPWPRADLHSCSPDHRDKLAQMVPYRTRRFCFESRIG